MLPTRTKFLTCLSTKALALFFVVFFIFVTVRLRQETTLTPSWSIDDAPVAGMFMPLTRPGWKTGNPDLDNSLHIVGNEARSAVIDAKGGDTELPPPEDHIKL